MKELKPIRTFIWYEVKKDIAMYSKGDILVQYSPWSASDNYYGVKGNDAHMIHIDIIKELPNVFTPKYS